MKKGILTIDTIVDYFSDKNHYSENIWFFRKAIYSFILINTILLLPLHNELWGTAPHVLKNEYHGIMSFINLLYFSYFEQYHLFFVFGLIITAIIGLMGLFPGLISFFVFFFSSNLIHKEISVTNGGYHLLLLMLFYLLFMNDRKQSNFSNQYFKKLTIIASNLGFWAARFQFIIVYLSAGILKLSGKNWLNGEAMYYVLRVEEYSNPVALNLFGDFSLLLTVMTWIALFYQLSFPVLIWIKPVRLPFLVLGAVFHLSIAFILGITDFGFMMIACYPLFLNQSDVEKIRKILLSTRIILIRQIKTTAQHHQNNWRV